MTMRRGYNSTWTEFRCARNATVLIVSMIRRTMNGWSAEACPCQITSCRTSAPIAHFQMARSNPELPRRRWKIHLQERQNLHKTKKSEKISNLILFGFQLFINLDKNSLQIRKPIILHKLKWDQPFINLSMLTFSLL